MSETTASHWCASHNPSPPEMRRLVSRRGFLRTGVTLGTAAAAASVVPWRAWAEDCADGVGSIPIEQRNIQLFTLLAAHLASPQATLTALYEIGYRNVEHIGVYVPDADSFRAAMDNAGPEGIAAPTGHTSIAHPFDHDQVMGLIEDAHVIGHQWLINPSIDFDDEAGWAAFGETLNQAGALAIANGLKGTAHHNHAQEYTPFDDSGRRPIDVLMGVCDPAVTSQEMDLCWVWSSETDPVEYLEKYPGRYRWFHVKDMNDAGQPTFPGLGLIDFDRIFEAGARTQTIEQYIIEHDAAPSGFESAKLGWDLLASASFSCPTAPASPSEPSSEPSSGPTSPPSGDDPAPGPSNDSPPAAPAADDPLAPLPATGGGMAALGLAGLGAVLALRNRGRADDAGTD